MSLCEVKQMGKKGMKRRRPVMTADEANELIKAFWCVINSK